MYLTLYRLLILTLLSGKPDIYPLTGTFTSTSEMSLTGEGNCYFGKSEQLNREVLVVPDEVDEIS